MKLRCLILAASLTIPAGAAFAEGDAVAGAKVFKQCQACHTATEAKNKVGPSLMGVVGRPVATVEGFKYSKAMKEFGEHGKVWTEELLTEYLPKPKDLVKGTIMAFAGLKKPEDIANVIAYLKSTSAQ
ncbi:MULTISPECIES: c-type cytochrome [Alphaproteobacteria]|uniref:Cytochrome c family protein n=2 Tax=Alphaproteobacteria TaxID=28211 RepID=A0A512HEY8_9HYPH|nr:MULTISPECIES: cytochrome c family protein [Alphaproteobacteria]GEO84008.1 cytochrome c family protein [Ciceribacter naphthalenivorans]GLR21114.1 cytochrome c family protein [Ciceribacter naphthalenivorans]GLT03970.1 cytochrome c family protein [Sphingomonas psychrolutea]